MQLTLHSTTKIVQVNGVPARIWEGQSAAGVKVHCFVTRVAVARDQDTSQFEAELEEHSPPSPWVQAIPLRLIL
jgi:hypothetical protein